MIFFLHDLGYNFFSIPKLTYPEINSLIETKNRMVKKQEKQRKQQMRKNKQRKKR